MTQAPTGRRTPLRRATIYLREQCAIVWALAVLLKNRDREIKSGEAGSLLRWTEREARKAYERARRVDRMARGSRRRNDGRPEGR